ncbi:serine/threonine-protein kinase Nek11-like isoform X1 [Lepisosteus oculatus]|uniref:non-specific serine/threonine protein kinase n=1 Tax=Lepisosteus oculatus TaxID=7918 RepID=W5M966_LEPOC|nr:PREDICTED: serine/threonine-protein kinase Nek11-like isoform X1 [Lepisosteus oculatus]XP_015223815.1 PREDICTED: serine/threonine-protein kinase Nek11-like isoform X1 [Lepisosteus oculatus]XP_015223816.1 PREDICTED: serine/threonine-protein kinase Nek11-like isoform X1 [Lepisosteus oculatus]XP_015223817.1 PREDICTED: serine/threonine-protein kinase Nek11-like isoform X1 [Lepisosteus oculatus]XP_015223818.1 PREDICTED: serine/threonine-protein kinase Nek11-like isoform X1 [Lepisosteus oculatus]
MEADLHPSDSFSLGMIVAGRYTLQRKLGSGSFATVYLVLDSKSKTEEQKKVLKQISVGNLKGDDTVWSAKEAQLLSCLDHPAIVHFYCSFVELQSFCIITEYCECGDLDSRIKSRWETGRLFPEGQVLEWLIQTLMGVQYLHERLILHRDLKTKNIFLKNFMIKIGDFGVSRILSGSLDCATTFTGTPHYMSPEIFTSSGYDAKSDMWSVGCVLYEIATLTRAFEANNWMKLVYKICQGPSPALPDCFSTELNDVLQSLLEKNPKKRPSATEILRIPFLEQHVKSLADMLGDVLHRETEESSVSLESARIAAALEKQVHLDSLQAVAQAQGLDPRERRRLRQGGDPHFSKVQNAVNQLYKQNQKRALKSGPEQDSEVSYRETEDGTRDEKDQGGPENSADRGDLEGGEEEFIMDDELEKTLVGSLSALSEEQSSTLRAYQSCLLKFLESSTTDDDQENSLTETNLDETISSLIESTIKDP